MFDRRAWLGVAVNSMAAIAVASIIAGRSLVSWGVRRPVLDRPPINCGLSPRVNPRRSATHLA